MCDCRVDKLTGALYLGEVCRRVLAQLVLDRLLFDGQECEKLDEPDNFPTKYILEILRYIHTSTGSVPNKNLSNTVAVTHTLALDI